MLGIYVVFLIVGMGLVALSFFTDADTDADVDLDIDADVDMDVDHDIDVGSMGDALWLPFISLRFYVFFAAFFGLVGTLLTATAKDMGQNEVMIASIVTGFITGYGASTIIRKLRSQRVDSSIDPARDYKGKRGKVLLEIEPNSPGQVRLTVKGSDVDITALVEGDERVASGAEIEVLEYRDNKVVVAPITADGSAA